MTREEIHEIANTIDPNIGKEIDEDYNCADVYDFNEMFPITFPYLPLVGTMSVLRKS